MVLAIFGIERTEEELRLLCDCGSEGTEALKLVNAARQSGFTGTRKHNLTIGELAAELKQGRNPIVYVRARLTGTPFLSQHAFVVINITQETVAVLDSWVGERQISIAEFERDWRQMRGLTILCQK
jgi:ABC-type bacteriocin/lantibiotic exporter with double-glycine peptidase domain